MKRIALLTAISSCCLLMSGCYLYPFPGYTFNISQESDAESDTASSDDQVPFDLKILEEDDTIKSSILDLHVNSAGLYESFEGNYPADTDWRILAVNVTLDSRFKNSAVLYIDSSQFLLTWDALDGYVVRPEMNLYITDQLLDYNNEVRLYKNSSRTGNLIFIVPKEAEGLKLIYQNFAIPFEAAVKTDPYNDYYYNDYYNTDPYYNMPYYEPPTEDWPEYYGGFEDPVGGEDPYTPFDISFTPYH